MRFTFWPNDEEMLLTKLSCNVQKKRKKWKEKKTLLYLFFFFDPC